MEKIYFTLDSGEEVPFYVLEQTRINGINYILVTDTEEQEEEGEALIMKEISGDQDREGVYEIVGEDMELNAVSEVFANLLDDITFEN